ncbi:MAG: acyl-CoA desaturase [Acidobacteria bacterium]|nr:MAG: acyl-CoA desaturase [Acidobacteriota bacterium]
MSTVAFEKPQPVSEDQIDFVRSLPFIGVHVACLAAFLTGVSWNAVLLCISLYVIRMFGITAGFHRYFSHRTYHTSRFFQLLLALVGCSALQKGPLWWASHHRRHHQHSDQEEDVHSPERMGFWWSHLGWILCRKYEKTDYSIIKDFAKYPELCWLNRVHVLPGMILAVGCFLFASWQGLVWGFFISTVLLYHGTFVINSLCHMFGRRRYQTTDTSRNSLILAIVTLGEGWHNNHHYYATSANQGFFWWELDISYYTLRLLSLCHLVWDLKNPPQHILDAARS